MRIRKKHNVNEKLQNFADIVSIVDAENFEGYPGNWRNLFSDTPASDKAASPDNKSALPDKKLFVELGTGKGDFISQAATLNPEIYFVGLEIEATVVYAAARKIREKDLQNVRLLVFDINNVDKIFAVDEIDRLHINFCDPWPKKRHAKRRLTNIRFLEKYRQILKPEGEIHFKTDNRGLFDYSLEQFSLANLKVSEVTYDLHSDNPTDNIETEYEKKFSALGVPICRCVVKF